MPENVSAMPLLGLKAVVLDTETTGLDARKARLVQVGCVRLRGGTVEPSVFETLVNPSVTIPKSAVAVHGITDAMVAEAPSFAAIADQLEAFVGEQILIGHAIEYDLTVLRREYALAKRTAPTFRALDVGLLARVVNRTLANYSLEHLCQWLDIDIVGRHTALGDARMTAELFLALVPPLRRSNVRTVAEAEAAIGSLEDAGKLGARLELPSAERPSLDTAPPIRVDSFPYRHLVRDVMSAPPLFAPASATVRDAVKLMIDHRVSSVFVQGASGQTGIVTERDLLRSIHAAGEMAVATPIEALMSAPLQTVAENAFVYRAIGRMDRLGVRHLGVDDGYGNIVGALTTRNLLRHRASTAIALGDEIVNAPTQAAMASAWGKLPGVARNLMQEEVDPRTIAAVVSSEIRSMTRRAAQLAEIQLLKDGTGPPPTAYAVLVLGSAGRGESQLAADQDNAIVYERGAEGGPEDTYFEKIGAIVSDILDAAGVPYCQGGVMAKNRAWRKSKSDWLATIDDWLSRQRPQDLLNVDIFFDALPVHGDLALGEEVWSYAYLHAHAARDFQNSLIEVTRNPGSPFKLMGGLRLDDKGRIDLKRFGLMSLYTSARVLSIRHDVRSRSTLERLRGVAAKGIGSPEIIESVLDAQRLLLGAIISQQLRDAEEGIPPSSRVDPRRLERRFAAQLKPSLKAVNEVVGLVGEGRL